MLGRVRPRLSYANLVSTLCLFLLLGGGAYAAGHLGKNSVGTKQLKKNAVTTAKIVNNAVTGAKVNESTLGTVPKARTAATASTANMANGANTANIANSLVPPEGWHEVGAPGEPKLLNSWHHEPGVSETAAFYKDQEGVVHLKGLVGGGSAVQIFQLPVGYRPTAGKLLTPIISCVGGLFCSSGVSSAGIWGSNDANEGMVIAPLGATLVGFDGISFRAES